MAYGPGETDHPDHRDSYRRAPLDPFRTREYAENQASSRPASATDLLDEYSHKVVAPRNGPRREGGATSHRKGKQSRKAVRAKARRRRKYVLRSVLGIFLLVFGYVGATIYPYITEPGSDPLEARVAEWGRDETMAPDVVGVRQNLSLLVDHGQVMADAGAGAGSGAKWGITVSNAFFVPRSGIGMAASGDIVYVGGADLSVLTLAQLLKAAGAVYGMELDINADWVSYMSYSPGTDPADPVPVKLWDFEQPANRYYQSSDRDFVSVLTR